MADDTQPTPVETVEDVKVEPTPSVDYRAEYEAEKARAERAAADRDNYKRMALKYKSGSKEEEQPVPATEVDIEEIITRKVSESISRIAAPSIDAIIAQRSGDPDEMKLIRHHFDHSTAGDDIVSRVDNAKILANAGLVRQQLAELGRMRANPIPQAVGSSSEQPPAPTTSTWSEAQLAEFRRKGLDPKKVEANLRGIARK